MTAYRLLQEADAVIALVAATALQSDRGAAVYEGCLPALFDLLARRAGRRPLLLALVVAQADRLPPPERDEPAEALLARRFPLPEAGPGLTVRHFLCSAAGFLDDDHRLANMDGDRLRDSSAWTPWRVHEPLLASLEGEERRRLHQGGSAVGRFLFARRRLAAYERDSLHALLRAPSQGA